MDQINDNVLLIVGESAAGKSAALRNLRDQEGVVYLNCDAGKKLPFKNKFQSFTIEQPEDVLNCFDAIAAGKLKAHTVVIDTLTFWFDMYETQRIVGAADGQKAWQNFQQIFKTLMQGKIASARGINVIVIAHALTTLNEDKGLYETKVPVKGALKNTGIEAYFTIVIAAKKMPVKKLEGFENDMLNITEQEQALGFKYVFQTQLTKDSTQERLRGPMGLFTPAETFVDNDAQKVLDHIHQYYNA